MCLERKWEQMISHSTGFPRKTFVGCLFDGGTRRNPKAPNNPTQSQCQLLLLNLRNKWRKLSPGCCLFHLIILVVIKRTQYRHRLGVAAFRPLILPKPLHQNTSRQSQSKKQMVQEEGHSKKLVPLPERKKRGINGNPYSELEGSEFFPVECLLQLENELIPKKREDQRNWVQGSYLHTHKKKRKRPC